MLGTGQIYRLRVCACVCVPDQAYHMEAREVCPAQAWYTYTHTIQRGQTCLGTVQLLMSAPLMWKSEGGGVQMAYIV